MKAWIWLRTLAGVMFLFTIGHTIGILKPPAGGSPAAAVLETMRSVRFPVMGFERSYGEFYRGFGLFVSLEFAILAVFAYQLSGVSRRDPKQAMPMAITLQAACVATAILSWLFFFAAPIVMSIGAVVCSTMAIVILARDSAAMTQGGMADG
jgi:hypothetical protein